MPLVMFDRTGPPSVGGGALAPGVVCDYCGELIHAEGNVLWWVNDRGEIPVNSALYFTHQTERCNAFEQAMEGVYRPDGGWLCVGIPLSDFLVRLAHNLAHPFGTTKEDREGRAHYVMPVTLTRRERAMVHVE